MADKCTMFDQYQCDRLVAVQRELAEAMRQKQLAREEADRLREELRALREQHHATCSSNVKLRDAISEVRTLIGDL